MITRLVRIGVGAAAVLGLAALGGMETRLPAQGMQQGNPGFRVNQGQPVTGAGGVKAYAPGGGGMSYSGPGGLPLGSYGMISSSPFSGITSTPYSSEAGSPYYGYGNWSYADPYGGYLKGAADVITATGKYGVYAQQAYLMKEQVRAAQVENRRRLFDEWLYERANTPSLQDELERIQKQELRRSRFDPPKTEIWSGKAMNDILEDLKRVDRNKVAGGNATVDEDVLKRINVTSGKGNINLGVLKNGGRLDWPLGLKSLGAEGNEQTANIQKLIDLAYGNAEKGNTQDPGTIAEIRVAINKLEGLTKSHINDLGFSQYTEAKAYLAQLRDGVNLLAQKDAVDYIKGKYSLANVKANTVAEVVKYMQDNGLQFAPAVDGEQAAYNALHRALANYDLSANTTVAQSGQ
jgi:hypothetical protein